MEMKKYNCGPWMVGALVAGLLMTLPPVASAGTIGIRDLKLIVGTEPGDGNQVIAASISGMDIVFSGLNFDIVTPGCSGFGTITCALSGFNELIVLGGNGDDAINLSAITAPAFSTLILGGPGNDVLIGSGGDDTIFGGPGDDVLIGGPGIDCLNSGPGNNVVIQVATSCQNVPDPDITPLPRPSSVPEPSALMLLGAGLGTLAIANRDFRKRLTK
jgi:Ca2+-binding RTX toxin-like protein